MCTQTKWKVQGRGDDLKNGKKMRFARSGPFSQILSQIIMNAIITPSMQYCELEDLGYNGFFIAFSGDKTLLVGISSTMQSFTPSVVELLHGIVVVCKC